MLTPCERASTMSLSSQPISFNFLTSGLRPESEPASDALIFG
jgi:hypothetical protein